MRIPWRILQGLLALCLLASAAQAQAQMLGGARESAVKAAYLLNFTTFVEWPPQALGPANQPFVIAVVGDDAVASELEQLAPGRNVAGHPLAVRRLRDVEQVEGAQVVYLGTGRESRVRDAMGRLGGPVLVVTHADGGLAAGAVLNFTLDNGRMRFEASQRNGESRGLRLSSRLLAVAVAVEGRGS